MSKGREDADEACVEQSLLLLFGEDMLMSKQLSLREAET